MKKLLLSLLTIICFVASAQEQKQLPTSTSEEANNLLIKSKKQRTTGIILITIGSAAVGTSFALAMNDLAGIFTEEDEDSGTAIDIFGYGGLVLIAGSIPFFVMSGQNKRKARLLTSSSSIEIIPGVPYGKRQLNIGVTIPIN